MLQSLLACLTEIVAVNTVTNAPCICFSRCFAISVNSVSELINAITSKMISI